MFRFKFNARGDEVISSRLRKTAAEAEPNLTDATYNWAVNKVRPTLVATPYPAMRTGQTYVRTGNLRKGFRVKRNKRSVTIVNVEGYSGHVIGDEKGRNQAWMHSGRWWTAKSVIDRMRPELRRDTIAVLDRMLK